MESQSIAEATLAFDDGDVAAGRQTGFDAGALDHIGRRIKRPIAEGKIRIGPVIERSVKRESRAEAGSSIRRFKTTRHR